MSKWLVVTTSLLLALPAQAADSKPLGRLFLSPADRAALDIVRLNNRPPERLVKPGSTDEDETNNGEKSAMLPVVTVQGYVKRTDGKGTVWVNGQALPEKARAKDFEVGKLPARTNEVPITLQGNSQTVRLKAGQSYDPATNMVGSLREITPIESHPNDIAPPAQTKPEKVSPPAPTSLRK